MRRSRAIPLILPPLLGLAAAPAVAWPESAEVATERTTATLVALPTDRTDMVAVGLRLRLNPGWHTYWRNPGDSGEAVTIRVVIDGRATAGPTAWPLPEAIETSGIVSYGHHGEAVFTTAAPLAAGAGSPARIEAEATWLACAHVCVPESAKFSLVAPAGAPHAAATATPPATPVRRDGRLSGTSDAWRIGVTRRDLGLDAPIVAAYFFPYDGELIDHSAPQKLSHGDDTMYLTLKPFDARKTPPRALVGLLRVQISKRDRLDATWIELTARAAPAAE